MTRLNFLDMRYFHFGGFYFDYFSYNNNMEKNSCPPLSFLETHDDTTGRFPLQILDLTRLTHLTLYSCGMTGPIPPDISKLRSLIVLTLTSNRLTGSF